MICKILTNFFYLPKAYYLVEDPQVGQWVSITCGNKKGFGIIIKIYTHKDLPYKIKKATSIDLKLDKKYIKFLFQISTYNMFSPCKIIQLLSKYIPKKIIFENQEIIYNLPELSLDQNKAYKKLKNNCNSLLWGITGSGKTEVWCHLFPHVLGQILILVPEILLAKHLYNRLKKYISGDILLWTNKNKNKKNFIHSFTHKIIISTRSGLFLPIPNLKLIIIDEEHDRSFYNFTYNYSTVESVLFRKVKTIFCSATPSLYTFNQIKQKKIQLVELKERYSGNLPTVSTEYGYYFSPELIKKIKNNPYRTIIYYNRRGFSTYIYCLKCDTLVKCFCGKKLIYHKEENIFKCHKCEKKSTICHLDYLVFYGAGVEKIRENLYKIFGSDISIVSSDITNFNGKILIGTQLISKGHDFKDVSLVIVMNVYQNLDSYKSSELIMQNILQVAGRAGRHLDQSEIIIKTNYPQEFFIQCLKNNDYSSFIKEELINRKKFKLPPFYKIIYLSEIDKNLFKNIPVIWGQNFFKISLENWKKYIKLLTNILKSSKIIME